MLRRLTVLTMALVVMLAVLPGLTTAQSGTQLCADKAFLSGLKSDFQRVNGFTDRITADLNSSGPNLRTDVETGLAATIKIRHKYEDMQTYPTGCDYTRLYILTGFANAQDAFTYSLLALDGTTSNDEVERIVTQSNRTGPMMDAISAIVSGKPVETPAATP